MIYGKLPVVFLSAVASEKSGSTNSTIAAYLLEHMDEVKDLGIKDLAGKCHVGTGSFSRFCKEIGLQDFVELRELLRTTELFYEAGSNGDSTAVRVSECGRKVRQSVDMVTRSISLPRLRALCEDLKNYQRIAAFGLLKAESAAINLQGDLLMIGRQVYTHVSYAEQMRYIREAGEDDLILIFSCTGSYFEYQKERLSWPEKKRPKIWMICGREPAMPEYVSKVLLYESLQDQASHPYQLQYAASLIAQEYFSLAI